MIVIIDYEMGNTRSVFNALNFLNKGSIISNKKEDLRDASHIILPGVGAFGEGMQKLKNLGLIDILSKEILENQKPFLGICLGMQLLAEEGEEGGINEGLGWVKGRVRQFQIKESKLLLPHIGWNDVVPTENATLFKDIENPVFYFVHSYFLVPKDENNVAGKCEYGENFTAAIQKENIFGTQFHPEKSQKAGIKLLENFLSYKV